MSFSLRTRELDEQMFREKEDMKSRVETLKEEKLKLETVGKFEDTFRNNKFSVRAGRRNLKVVEFQHLKIQT